MDVEIFKHPTTFLGYLEGACERQLKQFDHDTDFTTVLHTVDTQGGVSIYGFLCDMPAKELCAALYTCEQLYGGSVMAGLIVAAWRTIHDAKKPLLIRPSMDPDHQEIVSIVVAHADGVIHSTGVLTRYPDKAPTLAPWERELNPQHTMGGFATVMLRGLSTKSKVTK